MKNIFEYTSSINAPLYERMRPMQLSDFIGQTHIVSPSSLLTRAILSGRLGSCIFYGPPGTGKTTLANIIAHTTQSDFVRLNAVTSGVSDAKKAIDQGRKNLELYGKHTYLLLDECHRWNKAQSDCVLDAIEKGYIIFIGSTTENPNIAMTPAIVSRCRIFAFYPLTPADIKDALLRAIADKDRGLGEYTISVSPQALSYFANASAGDLRNALNALELAVVTTPATDGVIVVDKAVASESIQTPVLSVDESKYFDLLSAFCKSLRGSDAEASLYYAQRLITAGCDPLIICRRLIALSSEDIGLADSQALIIANAAHYAVKNLGLPEGNIPLSHAIIYFCEAPKSNSVIVALNLAKLDATHNADDKIPPYLRDHTYADPADTRMYKYPPDFGGYVYQQYMPDSLRDRVYYTPSKNGLESTITRKKVKNL